MDDLGHLFASEFESYVAELFVREEGQVLLRGDDVGCAPYIGDLFFVTDETHIARLKQRVCRALAARAWHKKHAPIWAQPLPLHRTELAKEWNDDLSPKRQLVLHFGYSLRWMGWVYKEHPTFPIYAAGVLAYEYAPPELRNDPELNREFAPCPLAGIDTGLWWNSPEMIAKERSDLERQPELWRAQGIPEHLIRIFVGDGQRELERISR